MKGLTPSHVASRPDRSLRSECPGCNTIRCAADDARVPLAADDRGRHEVVQDLTRNAPAPNYTSCSVSASQLHPLLTIGQVAEALCVSTKTVRRLRIPCFRIGRSVRYRPSDVERFLAARRFHA